MWQKPLKHWERAIRPKHRNFMLWSLLSTMEIVMEDGSATPVRCLFVTGGGPTLSSTPKTNTQAGLYTYKATLWLFNWISLEQLVWVCLYVKNRQESIFFQWKRTASYVGYRCDIYTGFYSKFTSQICRGFFSLALCATTFCSANTAAASGPVKTSMLDFKLLLEVTSLWRISNVPTFLAVVWFFMVIVGLQKLPQWLCEVVEMTRRVNRGLILTHNDGHFIGFSYCRDIFHGSLVIGWHVHISLSLLCHFRNPGVAFLDQVGRGGHRLHGWTGVHVRPVQSLHSSVAKTKGV